MVRFIIPLVLVVLAILGFILFANPLYQDIVLLRSEASSYDEALDNSKQLENERDKLTQKYNTITPENLDKLEKMLPDSVDNIRLILEIERIAVLYGMALQDVQYDAQQGAKGGSKEEVQIDTPTEANEEYGMWELSFSTQGTYSNFINFLKDLERNLRIVDIGSIQFSSDIGTNIPGLTEVYQYSVIINTYWLKN